MSGIRGIDEGPSDKEEKEKAARNVVVSQDQHEQNPSSSSNSSSPHRQRQPKITYIQPARIIRVKPSEFKALVQKLTAMPKEEPGGEEQLMTDNHPCSPSSTNPPLPPSSVAPPPPAYYTEVPSDVNPDSSRSGESSGTGGFKRPREEPQCNPSIEEDLDDDGNWWRWWWW